jgi:hypothetical protein
MLILKEHLFGINPALRKRMAKSRSLSMSERSPCDYT